MSGVVTKWFGKVENRIVVWGMVTALAIAANLFTTSTVVVFMLNAEERHQARNGRLAAAIGRIGNQVNRELKVAADDLDQLLYLNRYPWTRNDMIEFCVEAEKKNKDFVCPDVLKISPELELLRKRDLPISPNLGDE